MNPLTSGFPIYLLCLKTIWKGKTKLSLEKLYFDEFSEDKETILTQPLRVPLPTREDLEELGLTMNVFLSIDLFNLQKTKINDKKRNVIYSETS